MPAPLDPQTMKAGLLMEAAEAHQQLAAVALKRLDAATRALGTLEPSVREAVRDAVAQAVSEAAKAEFAQLRAEAQRTSQALQSARSGLGWSFGVIACAMSVVTAGMLVGGIYLLGGFAGNAAAGPVASPAAGLQGEPAALAEIARRGLQPTVALCGQARRPCVKVDPKAGSFGPRKDHMVLAAP